MLKPQTNPTYFMQVLVEIVTGEKKQNHEDSNQVHLK